MSILLDLRTQRQFTQQEVCRLTKIPFNTYRRYEYGQREPSFRAIIALARLYGMRPGDLFEELAGVRQVQDPPS